MQKHAFSIYDASAGSGKTYTLVKEYLKIVLLSKREDAYRNILAITFTNKAVHEMKSRVVESLTEFSKENPSDKASRLMQDINVETGLSLQAITQKSKNIIKHLIHNYAAFDILTIDKFTHRVIRAFAKDLNLSVSFEVSLDTENLLTEAIDAIIAQAGENWELTDLLVNYTMEKTDDDKSWDVSREIMETGKLLLNENNREEITHFHNKSVIEFLEIKKKLQELSQEIEKETVELASKGLSLIEKKGIDLNSFSRQTFPKHLISIQQRKFNPKNKMFYEVEDIQINKTATDRLLIEEIIPELLQILEVIYKKFGKIHFYQAFLKNITPLSLLNTISNELKKIQEEQNVLSISEFNQIIHDQIQNQPAPFIYERLGEKYKHFFIDEFQDTSQMQWHNLIPLIDDALSSENLQGERGSLMIVGDPKQSIYRWRGGKAEQFMELSKDHNPFANKDKKWFPLETNYRSFSEVIGFNNHFFKFIANEFVNENYKDLYQNHSYQEENDKKGGCVTLSFLPKKENALYDSEDNEEDNNEKDSAYLEAVYQTIEKSKSNGFNYGDIAVLTRKREQGTAIAGFLTEKNIPILSSESLLLNASNEVQCILAVLGYLKNKSDIQSKAEFLYYIGSNCQKKLAVHDFIAEGKNHNEEKDFEIWLNGFDINFSFSNIRKKSLYETVEIIISNLISIENRNAYVQYFLDLIWEHDLKKQAGITEFLQYWENNFQKKSIPSPEGKDAVQIMTIHASKGLEFPVVIFPFADQNYSSKPKEKMWLNADEEVVGLPKVLVDKNSKVEGFGEEASLNYLQKKQEELLDDINVLYVALTRAEEQLHIISRLVTKNNKGNYPNSMATFFIRFLESSGKFEDSKLNYQFGSSQRISSIKKKEDKSRIIPQIKSTLNFKNIQIAQRESLMWNTKQQNAIGYGNTIHEILSFVKTHTDIDLALQKATENGLIITTQTEEVRKTIVEITNHPDLIDYFSEENKILNEQTILQKEGHLVKPDRMVINSQNEVFLLDYKTGVHQTKYETQLNNYQSAIESMDFKVVKKVLVYIGNEINIIPL